MRDPNPNAGLAYRTSIYTQPEVTRVLNVA